MKALIKKMKEDNDKEDDQYKEQLITTNTNNDKKENTTDFTINQLGTNVEIKTVGYGHGVGMSQYGAQGMATSGYNYKQILNHYYTNTKIKKLEN